MIFDGKWKKELKHLSFEITVFQRLSILGDFAEHRLNRAVLYSATILRKIAEDENEAEAIAKKMNVHLPKQKTIYAPMKAIRYPYTGQEGWAVRSKLCVSDYGNGQDVCVKPKDVCNWLLHSYVWGIAHNSNEKCFAGFLVASDFDKEKFVYFISFEEWRKIISTAIEDGVF